ncbi:MAG: tRNA (adenosine(37)-N6)-dimethylallyltransferase MiaA [Candidatus Latescibacteria bacterium]|nr:tRNA (adenosine(37)-N6)-dimethylallyltransferase MiaA [Candidatus Latescibacterota bacterium]
MLRKLIIIAGPTAVGKTSLAITVASEVGGQIISADSRQIYRYMEVATAKPNAAERAAVEHHGLDLRDPDEPYSAGEFSRYARDRVREMWRQDLIPVVVGGTGLYLQALLDGLWRETVSAQTLRDDLKARLSTQGVEGLHHELGHLDAVAQSRIAATDTQRVLRALELAHLGIRGAGHGWDPLPCVPVAFCLNRTREQLYRRIDQRVEAMVAQGLIAEVEQLLDKGYTRSTRAMQSLGYEDLLDHLDGVCSLDAALAKMRLRTRQYAKRQLTWFRKDRRFRWLDLDRWGSAGGVERVLAEIRNRRGL